MKGGSEASDANEVHVLYISRCAAQDWTRVSHDEQWADSAVIMVIGGLHSDAVSSAVHHAANLNR